MERNTIQLDFVSEAVHTLDHPTADMVYEYIADKYPSVSRGTVYRNLGKLAANGSVQRILMADGADRFDFRVQPHHHFKCEKCGRIFDMGSSPGQEVSKLVDKNFVLKDYYLELVGLCPQCK